MAAAGLPNVMVVVLLPLKLELLLIGPVVVSAVRRLNVIGAVVLILLRLA